MSEYASAKPLAAFSSPEGTGLLAVMSPDSRFKIWDACSGECVTECTDPALLALKYTCLAWGFGAAETGGSASGHLSAANGQAMDLANGGTNATDSKIVNGSDLLVSGGRKAGAKTKRKKGHASSSPGPASAPAADAGSSAAAPLFVALGTKQGEIVLWNHDLGRVHCVLGRAAAGSGSAQPPRAHGTSTRVLDLVFGTSVGGDGGFNNRPGSGGSPMASSGHTRKSNAKSATSPVLYSAGDDRLLVEWSLVTGLPLRSWPVADEQPAYKLALSPDSSWLVSAANQLRVWPVAVPTVKATRSAKSKGPDAPLATLPGHASKVVALQFSSSGTMLASADNSQRTVLVWSLAGLHANSGAAVRQAPVFTLAAGPSMPTQFAWAVSAGGVASPSNSQYLVVLGESLSVNIWQLVEPAKQGKQRRRRRSAGGGSSGSPAANGVGDPSLSDASGAAKPADCVVTVGDSSSKVVGVASRRPTVLAVAMAGHTLRLALSGSAQLDPVFTSKLLGVSGGTESEQPVGQCSLVAKAAVDIESGFAAAGRDAKRARGDSNVLGTGPMAPRSVASVPSGVTVMAPSDVAVEKGVVSGDAAAAETNTPSSLSAAAKSALAVASATAAASASGTSAPVANTVHASLSRALDAGDGGLLESLLEETQQETVISATLARLHPHHVLPLLTALTQRLLRKPTRGRLLNRWLRELLVHHTAYLSATPAASAALLTLYRCVDSRLANFPDLLRLSGRLELVLSQAEHAASSASAPRLGAAVSVPPEGTGAAVSPDDRRDQDEIPVFIMDNDDGGGAGVASNNGEGGFADDESSSLAVSTSSSGSHSNNESSSDSGGTSGDSDDSDDSGDDSSGQESASDMES